MREVPTCRILSQIPSKLKGPASALAAIVETGNLAKTLRPQSEWESRETHCPPPVNHLGSAGRDIFENLWCKTTGKLAAPRNNVHSVLDAPVEARGDHLLVKQTLENTMGCKTSAVGTS